MQEGKGEKGGEKGEKGEKREKEKEGEESSRGNEETKLFHYWILACETVRPKGRSQEIDLTFAVAVLVLYAGLRPIDEAGPPPFPYKSLSLISFKEESDARILLCTT